MLDTPSVVNQTADSRRPPLFSRKTQGSEAPGTRDLRLLLNKLTPASQDKLLPSLLAMNFTPDLLNSFESLLIAKVSDLQPPVATLKTFAECCFQLKEKLQPDLAERLVESLGEKLSQAVRTAGAQGEAKQGSLIGLTGALAATGFSPGLWLFRTLDEVLETPSEVAVEATCLVYKVCVREVLRVEDIHDRAEVTLNRLHFIWSENRFPKKTQFHIQNLLDSREEILTPAEPLKPVLSEPALIRRPSNKIRKRVTFTYPANHSDDSPSTIDSPPESAAKSCLSPICRTFISSETKVKSR